MSLFTRFAAGVTGAVALTAVHETVRQMIPDAPRMDILGERGLNKIVDLLGGKIPPNANVHEIVLYGDLASNALYFSKVRTGPGARRRGFLLGLLAGLGALYLPEPLGLGKAPHSDSPRNRWLTVLYYVVGGLVAGQVAHSMSAVQDDE